MQPISQELKLEDCKKFVEAVAKDLAEREKDHTLSPMEDNLLCSIKRFYENR